MARIAIIQGHPDTGARHYGHALADAYAEGADQGGHEVRRLDVAALDLPIVHSRSEWEGEPPPRVRTIQDTLRWAEHLVLCYPLWLGSMPALLKAFLEQVLRPGFAFCYGESGGGAKRLLRGKSARVVVTMGMPALFYRLYFRAHSLRSLERNILHFCGIAPVRHSLIGLVEGGALRREHWLQRMQTLGHRSR